MMTKEWWQRNAGGLFLSAIIGVAMYAASAYITSAVTKEMKSYVPVVVWNQWAQERGEWRGEVTQRIKSLEDEGKRQRDEIMKMLNQNNKEVAVQTMLLQELKAEFLRHTENGNSKMRVP
jgi:hypothetical protein